MPQGWFAANAPTSSTPSGGGGGWFAQNAPQVSEQTKDSTYSTVPAERPIAQPTTGGMLRNELTQIYNNTIGTPLSGLASIPEGVRAITDPATWKGMGQTASDVGGAVMDLNTYRGLWDQAKQVGHDVGADPVAAGLKFAYDQPGNLMTAAVAGPKILGKVPGVGKYIPQPASELSVLGHKLPWSLPEPPALPGVKPGAVERAQNAMVTRGGAAKAGASAQYESALSGPLSKVKVPTGGTTTMTPPPGAPIDTGAVGAGGQPIMQSAPVQPPVEVPETVSMREAHEAKGAYNPYRDQGVQPVTPQQRLAFKGRQAAEEAMSGAAAKAGVDFGPMEDAADAYKQYQDTFRRGPVRKAVNVAPAKFTDFMTHPERWNTSTKGGAIKYEGGKLPRAMTPSEVIGNFEDAAGKPAWQEAQHHVQASLLDQYADNPAGLIKQLDTLDKHGVTQRLLPNGDDLRAWANKSISSQQLRNRIKTGAKLGLGAAGLAELYRNYDKVKDLF